MKTHLKPATKFTPKSPKTEIKTTLQRHSISKSLIGKTEDKASSNIDTKNTTSLSDKTNKISFVTHNFNISAQNKKTNTNICFIPTQVSFNNIQASKLQTIRKKAINSNFRSSKTRQENSNSTSVNPVLIIQRQSIIKKGNKTLSKQRKFDRLYNKFTSKPKSKTFFKRLYNFQRKRSNWKFVESRSDIQNLRQKLVNTAIELYPDKINLYGAKSIKYVHSKNPKKSSVLATAYPSDKSIKVWGPCMGKEINQFLNTIRHEGYHIAQFKARKQKLIPKINGDSKFNRALLEFLSEYRELVGGFKETLKPLTGDVARFVENYIKIPPNKFRGKWRNWRSIILNKGIKAAEAVKKRIKQGYIRINTIKNKSKKRENKYYLRLLNGYYIAIKKMNKIFDDYKK